MASLRAQLNDSQIAERLTNHVWNSAADAWLQPPFAAPAAATPTGAPAGAGAAIAGALPPPPPGPPGPPPKPPPLPGAAAVPAADSAMVAAAAELLAVLQPESDAAVLLKRAR
jgi:hypothetical protein